MNKVLPISGFAEWLPEHKRVEAQLMQNLAQHFELFGYTPLETRSVEAIDTLTAKGEIEKEIYTLTRLQADANEKKEARLGLHFDLTVPLARYVVEHESALHFPFKRYQMQRVWRGERPQTGRYREFYQVDLDVLADLTLPFAYEVEVVEAMLGALKLAPLPAVQMHVSTREIMDGALDSLNIADKAPVFQAIDKLAKIGESEVRRLLLKDDGLAPHDADAILALAKVRCRGDELLTCLPASYREIPRVMEGAQQLVDFASRLRARGHTNVVIDLSIVRGLDYYTGLVFETFIVANEALGSVCSGGRYDNLTGQMGRRKKMPGIGLSIGLTRLLSYLFRQPDAPRLAPSPTVVLIALCDDARLEEACAIAAQLRARSIAAEVFPSGQKLGKQIKYAEKREIPFVLFDTDGDYGRPSMRHLKTGTQQPVDLATWTPSSEKLS